MIVGAWNIERAAGIASKSERARDRAQWAATQLVDWFAARERMDENVPALMFLSEVSQGGGEMAAYLMRRLENYSARYIEVGDRLNSVSPCSFIVLWHQDLEIHFGGLRIEPTGATTKRPMVKVFCVGGVFACVHIIANQNKSADEILTALTEIGSAQRAMLIGDMNYPYAEIDTGSLYAPSLESQALDLTFRPRHPGLMATHGRLSRRSGAIKTQILDYAWSTGITSVDPQPPIPGYMQWSTIDHAPIAYEVNVRL